MIFAQQWVIITSIIVPLVCIVLVGLAVFFSRKKNKKIKQSSVSVEAPTIASQKKVSPVEDFQAKAIVRANKKMQQYKLLSEMGLRLAPKLQIAKEDQGTEVIGIIYNEKSKVYLFCPKEEHLNIGDVVIVKDLHGSKRTVPVVLSNQLVSEKVIARPLKEIEGIAYKNPNANDLTEEITADELILESIDEAQAPIAEEKIEGAPEEVIAEEASDEEQIEVIETELEEESVVVEARIMKDEEVPEETEVTENSNSNETMYQIVRTSKSFEAKLSLLPEETKTLYSEVKNALLQYGLKSRMNKSSEKFLYKKEVLAVIKVATKSFHLCLALDPETLEGTKYKGRNQKDKASMVKTPFVYTIKTERKCKWAKELISKLAQSHELVKATEDTIDFAGQYPNYSENKLMEKGWITKKVIVTSKKPRF